MYKNKIKEKNRQAVIHPGLCLFVFLFLMFCWIRVLYVTAASVSPKMLSGKNVSLQEQIRMANEDAIPVTEAAITVENILFIQSREYEVLTRIVEAEATGLDEKSKILVANVVLNRVKHKDFPNTIEEVVFQEVNGVIQFSPIADGRYYTVTVTDTTKECVNRAIAGEDYSKGALYFMERSYSSPDSVRWFDSALTRLFQYQSHEFYK